MIDILARDAPVAPGALDPRGIDAMLLTGATDGRGEPGFGMPLRKPGPSRAKRFTGGVVSSRFALGLGSCLSRSIVCADPAQQCARRSLGIRVEYDFRQHTRGRRRHFLRHLVGLKFDQGVVLGNLIADRLEPGADDRLGAFLLVGNANFDHDQKPTSRSISARMLAGDGSAHSISLG